MKKSYMVMKQGNMWVILDMATRAKHSEFSDYNTAVERCMKLNGII